MAISDKLTYLNDTKTQLKDMINYGLDTGEKITSETTFRNYVKSLFDAFIKTMTYPDVLYNNLPKVTGEGTSVTLNDTVYAPMRVDLSPSELEQGANPSPDYPQEIHTVSGENTITISNSDNTQNQTYLLSLGDLEYCKIGDYEDGFVRNSGKNLLNRAICDEDKGLVWARGDTFSDTNSLVSNYIKVEANESLSFNYKAQVLFYDSSQNYLGALKISSGSATIIVGTGTYENQITIPNVADVYYMRLGFRTSQNDNIDMTAVDIMVNKGSSLLPYEPYGSGKWYLKKNIGKVVLDGSESDWFNDGGGAPFSVHVPLKGVNNKLMVMSDYFRGVTYSSSWTVYDTLVSTSAAAATNPAIKFRYIGIGGLDDFKTWLSTHNTTVYYVLATQTYTLLSDTLQTQLDNIQKAISYQDQTNVSQTNADLPFVISASAIKNYEEI